MYGEDLKPIGLYVENGRTLRKLNRRNGPGNFHLKPNGVFFIDGAKGGVMDFAGMMESYNAVYAPLKKKPARITSQVAGITRSSQ